MCVKNLLKKRKIFGHVTNTSLIDNKCYGSVHSKSERGGWQKENRNKNNQQRSSVYVLKQIDRRLSAIPGISWDQIRKV